MSRAEVSVITGAYNCSAYIGEAYGSLRHQTMLDWEWVVVDDASTDDTLDLLIGVLQNNSRVRVLTNRRNLGAIHPANDRQRTERQVTASLRRLEYL